MVADWLGARLLWWPARCSTWPPASACCASRTRWTGCTRPPSPRCSACCCCWSGWRCDCVPPADLGMIVLVGVFQLATAPVAAQMIGRAAYRSGPGRPEPARRRRAGRAVNSAEEHPDGEQLHHGAGRFRPRPDTARWHGRRTHLARPPDRRQRRQVLGRRRHCREWRAAGRLPADEDDGHRAAGLRPTGQRRGHLRPAGAHRAQHRGPGLRQQGRLGFGGARGRRVHLHLRGRVRRPDALRPRRPRTGRRPLRCLAVLDRQRLVHRRGQLRPGAVRRWRRFRHAEGGQRLRAGHTGEQPDLLGRLRGLHRQLAHRALRRSGAAVHRRGTGRHPGQHRVRLPRAPGVGTRREAVGVVQRQQSRRGRRLRRREHLPAPVRRGRLAAADTPIRRRCPPRRPP